MANAVLAATVGGSGRRSAQGVATSAAVAMAIGRRVEDLLRNQRLLLEIKQRRREARDARRTLKDVQGLAAVETEHAPQLGAEFKEQAWEGQQDVRQVRGGVRVGVGPAVPGLRAMPTGAACVHVLAWEGSLSSIARLAPALCLLNIVSGCPSACPVSGFKGLLYMSSVDTGSVPASRHLLLRPCVQAAEAKENTSHRMHSACAKVPHTLNQHNPHVRPHPAGRGAAGPRPGSRAEAAQAAADAGAGGHVWDAHRAVRAAPLCGHDPAQWQRGGGRGVGRRVHCAGGAWMVPWLGFPAWFCYCYDCCRLV